MRAFILLLATFVLSGVAVADDRCQISQNEKAQLLMQPVEVFDADPQLGWRKYWKAKCKQLAIELLFQYQAGPTRPSRINFHEAQLRLDVGDSAGARPLLFASLRSDISPYVPFRWNDYVLRYIAFVDADAVALDYYIGRLEQASADHGNAMNLSVLRKLKAGLGQPYRSIFPSD
jgi:hypothetical protein